MDGVHFLEVIPLVRWDTVHIARMIFIGVFACVIIAFFLNVLLDAPMRVIYLSVSITICAFLAIGVLISYNQPRIYLGRNQYKISIDNITPEKIAEISAKYNFVDMVDTSDEGNIYIIEDKEYKEENSNR